MSLLVAAALGAGSFLVGRWVMRGGRVEEATAPAKVPSGNPSPTSTPASAMSFTEFPCALGDVVLRTGGDEAWLAGALVFSEDAPIAILFIAPDSGGDRGIFVSPRPSSGLAWLAPLGADALAALALGHEPPNALEHEGLWFARRRRLPVRVTRIGTGAPDIGEQVILAEYGASGAERLIVVTAPGVTRAWRGAALEEALYEVIASGSSTL